MTYQINETKSPAESLVIDLFPTIASISSKNSIHGTICLFLTTRYRKFETKAFEMKSHYLASLNCSRMYLSESPKNGEKTDALSTLKNPDFVAFATAHTSVVFEHPAGPWSSIPC